MKKSIKTGGFTLVELMIALSIVAIIAAIGYPNYVKHMRKSNRSEGQAELLRLAGMQERFYLQNNTYTNALSDLSDNANTANDFYTMAVSSADASAFTLTATAVAGGPQQNDAEDGVSCSVISLTSAGQKTPAECWK